MSYIRLSDMAYPVSEQEIRAAYPDVSFPTPFRAPEEFAVVFPVPQPAHDTWTHGVREIAPALTSKGTWEQSWEVYPIARTAEEESKRLADTKAAKLAAIHAEKNRARDGGFVVDGVLFDSDLPARTSYAELAIAMQTDPTLTMRWKASDGVWVDMTSVLFQQVYAAGRAHIEACFAWQEAKEQAVAMATTYDDVMAIVTTYGG